MPWNGGIFPDRHDDTLIDNMNKNIYAQYDTYLNKTEALLACHLDKDCPWVFDEKCDGIGPFVKGYRAKKTFQCPKFSRKNKRRRLSKCNSDCLYEKAGECTSSFDGVCSVPDTLKNWIPQWTLSLFEEDCIAHDFCYTCGDFLKLGRQRCDEKFFNMMVQSCRKQEYARRNTCVYWARGYFDAVSSYGENNYDGKASCCNKTVILNEAVDGKWSNWSPWSQCGNRCTPSTQHRFRSCTKPPPSQFGMSCNGFLELSDNISKPEMNIINVVSDDWKYVGVEKKAYENIYIQVYENRSCINACDNRLQ